MDVVLVRHDQEDVGRLNGVGVRPGLECRVNGQRIGHELAAIRSQLDNGTGDCVITLAP